MSKCFCSSVLAAPSLFWRISLLVCALAVPLGLAAAQDVNGAGHHHYKLIDMGTFGGPASSINFPFSQGVLNNRGMAVGWSATSVPMLPTSNFFVCGGFFDVVPFITHAFEWNGAVRDLGALPPSETNCSEPTFMNSKGEVVGLSETGEVDPQFFGLQQVHAVLWRNGEIIDLGTLGGNIVGAFGINERGQIAGNSTNAIPDPFCFFGTDQNRAFLWENGQMRDLGTLGGNCASVIGAGGGVSFHPINDAGQIIGASTTDTVVNPLTGNPTWDPFLWEKGKGMTDLGTLGGAFGSAQAINNRGQIIGQSSIAADPGACNGFPDNGDFNCHAFLWDHGRLLDLTANTAGGRPALLVALNDAGEIIGWGRFPGSPLEAFLWRNGAAIDLGHLDGCFSFTHSINSQGQVVGAAISCDGTMFRAFLWEHGSMVDLNSLIAPGSSLELIDATDINERGEIVGDGVPPGTSRSGFADHGFVLIPCDDNHPGIEGCDYSTVEVSTAVTGHTSQPQKRLAPQEISRILDQLMNRHRGFMPKAVR